MHCIYTVVGAEMSTTKAIAGRQTRDAINSARSLAGTWEPANGWVRTIRKALAMTAGQLGRRMGTAESTITQMERKEKNGEITLKQLSRAAGAMNCRLVYAIVPEQPIEKVIEAQALRKAQQELAWIDNSMRLEGQSVDEASMSRAIKSRAQELIDNPTKELWAIEDVG
jgi:predicted DNA-binding mobile mystery protein A